MESYRILPLNCALRKVLQLVGIRPQEFFAAMRLFANWSICVLWADRDWRVSTGPREAEPPKTSAPLRQRAVHRGRGPGGRFGRFHYLAQSGRLPHLRNRNWTINNDVIGLPREPSTDARGRRDSTHQNLRSIQDAVIVDRKAETVLAARISLHRLN